MVIRTSIVGEEKEHFLSLISWVKSQANKEVNGFTNHFWNGITTNYFGIICNKIISEDLYQNGIYHVFSKNDVSKYEMLDIFNSKWNLNLKINATQASSMINRTLRTEKSLNNILNLPTFNEMVQEM